MIQVFRQVFEQRVDEQQNGPIIGIFLRSIISLQSVQFPALGSFFKDSAI